MKSTITKKVGETQVIESITETLSSEQQNSVKVSRNAKGDHALESKVYHDDLEELKKIASAQLKVAHELIVEDKQRWG